MADDSAAVPGTPLMNGTNGTGGRVNLDVMLTVALLLVLCLAAKMGCTYLSQGLTDANWQTVKDAGDFFGTMARDLEVALLAFAVPRKT